MKTQECRESISAERSRFERWFSQRYTESDVVRDASKGHYINDYARIAWDAWVYARWDVDA